jgi:hypothetical protein
MIRGNICNFVIFFFFFLLIMDLSAAFLARPFGMGVLGVPTFCSFLGGLVLERSKDLVGAGVGLHDWWRSITWR